MSKQKIIITMMENNQVFIKKEHIKTQSKKDVLVILILQETKNFNLLFGKICTQENVKCHIQHAES